MKQKFYKLLVVVNLVAVSSMFANNMNLKDVTPQNIQLKENVPVSEQLKIDEVKNVDKYHKIIKSFIKNGVLDSERLSLYLLKKQDKELVAAILYLIGDTKEYGGLSKTYEVINKMLEFDHIPNGWKNPKYLLQAAKVYLKSFLDKYFIPGSLFSNRNIVLSIIKYIDNKLGISDPIVLDSKKQGKQK